MLQRQQHAILIQKSTGATWESLIAELGPEGRIDDAYRQFTGSLDFATASVSGKGLAVLDRSSQVDRIELASQVRPSRMPAGKLRAEMRSENKLPARASSQSRRAGELDKSAHEPSVLYAMIDSGCPFMHPLLCKPQPVRGQRSTRIRALWDQDTNPEFGGYSTRVDGFSYGAQVSRSELNRAIQQSNHDESNCYRRVGYSEMRHAGSHGSHSLGLMLGYGTGAATGAPGVRDDCDIVFVQLPRVFLFTPSRAALAKHLLDGLIWIASQRRANEKLVISIGRGSPLGPHDGTSIFEQAMDQFTQQMGDALEGIYIAAGNEYDSELHASATPQSGKPSELVWRVLPDSEMSAFLELWIPTANAQAASTEVWLAAPDGRRVLAMRQGGLRFWPSESSCIAAAAFARQTRGDAVLCLIRLSPTRSFDSRQSAAAGDWKITVSTSSRTAAPVHLYIGRVTPSFNQPIRGRQSHFLREAARNALAPDPEYSLQGFATSTSIRSVGGYRVVGETIEPANYTASGPSRCHAVKGPNYSVRTEEGATLPGRKSIGHLSGASFRMDGTSLAAPLAAHYFALRVNSKAARVHEPIDHDNPRRLGRVLTDV